jgi:hypothetical protein
MTYFSPRPILTNLPMPFRFKKERASFDYSHGQSITLVPSLLLIHYLPVPLARRISTDLGSRYNDLTYCSPRHLCSLVYQCHSGSKKERASFDTVMDNQ